MVYLFIGFYVTGSSPVQLEYDTGGADNGYVRNAELNLFQQKTI